MGYAKQIHYYFLVYISYWKSHVATEDATYVSFYRRVNVGNNLMISHLFYVGDVLLIGECSIKYISNMVIVLNWFYLFFWNKVEFIEIKYIRVTFNLVEDIEIIKGCKSDKLLFV